MLARPGVHHCKLKNASWSLSPELALFSQEQEGGVLLSRHSSAETDEIMPRKSLQSHATL